MTADILTVFLKEWNEYLHARGTRRGTLFTFVLPVAIFGILFPVQTGRAWIESPISALSFAWLPLLYVSAMTADSFAGERERHTLETLLASRLPDIAILTGKILAAMSYGLLITALIVVSGVVGVNLIHGHGEFIFYPVKGFAVAMMLCVLMSFFIGGLGVLVSLKAATVRQAQQTMSFGIIIIALLPSMLFGFMPQVAKKYIFTPMKNADMLMTVTVVITVLVIMDALVMFIAAKRFNRRKLL